MQRKRLFVIMAIVSFVFISSRDTHSQSPDADGHRFEVGGQFSVLSNRVVTEVDATAVICVRAPCLPFVNSFSKSRKTQPGLGGRFGYNLTDDLAIESELNFFPKVDPFSQPGLFDDGHVIEGLFGIKAGKRFEKAGVFGKARPGFLYASKGDLENKPGAFCIAIFPPSTGCSQTISTTSFAFDLGGVVELYPTKRSLIRFDVGDTMVRLGQRNVTAVLKPPFGGSNFVVVAVPAETTHNLQVSAGVGFRF